MRKRNAVALLYVVCLFALPCFYFTGIIVGVAPLSAITALTSVWLFNSGGDGVRISLGLLSLVNVVVWGALLLLACRWAVCAIHAAYPNKSARAMAATLVGVLCVGLLPIYWVAGHGTPDEYSAYQLFVRSLSNQL
jgi:hypothetical protein